MATRYLDVHVKCPFYVRYDGHKIVCEGLQISGAISVDLKTIPARDEWMCKYCNTNYKSCLLYKMMEGAYVEK